MIVGGCIQIFYKYHRLSNKGNLNPRSKYQCDVEYNIHLYS